MRTLNDYFLTSKITTISTAGSTFVPVPDGGTIIKIFTAIKNAISSITNYRNIVQLDAPATPENILLTINQINKKNNENWRHR